MNIPKRILLVEASNSVRELYKQMLDDKGYDVVEAGTFEQGFAMAISEQPDLVLLNIMLPQVQNIELDREGVVLLSCLCSAMPHLPVIMVTSIGSEAVKTQCHKLGAAWYFDKSKNESLNKLLGMIESVLATVEPTKDLATELEQSECSVFARGKHTELDVVQMRPGLRTEIIAALREASIPRLYNHCEICGIPHHPNLMVICVDCANALKNVAPDASEAVLQKRFGLTQAVSAAPA